MVMAIHSAVIQQRGRTETTFTPTRVVIWAGFRMAGSLIDAAIVCSTPRRLLADQQSLLVKHGQHAGRVKRGGHVVRGRPALHGLPDRKRGLG